mmetsp:Transcript_16826/g.59750  ORF Transcript_16826/g.59750 Transcript_16826/m.59750 type:complete len:337 (-) Transcript_16826:2094-3104(-)
MTSSVMYCFVASNGFFVTAEMMSTSFMGMRSLTFFALANDENRIDTPNDSIETSRPYSSSKCATSSRSVMPGWSSSMQSQAVHSQDCPARLPPANLATVFAGGDGSEKAKSGSARLTKPHLSASKGWPWTSLMSSRQARPATRAVVVAMAGTTLPAICLARSTSTLWMAKDRPRAFAAAAMKSTWYAVVSSFRKSVGSMCASPAKAHRLKRRAAPSSKRETSASMVVDARKVHVAECVCTKSSKPAAAAARIAASSASSETRKQRARSSVAVRANATWSASSMSKAATLRGRTRAPDQNSTSSSSKESAGCFASSSSTGRWTASAKRAPAHLAQCR